MYAFAFLKYTIVATVYKVEYYATIYKGKPANQLSCLWAIQ